MTLVLTIELPDGYGPAEVLEILEDGRVAIDEAFLTRWDEDDSYFVFGQQAGK